METPLTVADRLRYIMSQKHLSQRQLAATLSLDPSNLSKALSGKLPFTTGLINRIVVDLGISKNWLLTGEGVPYEKGSSVKEIEPSEETAPSSKPAPRHREAEAAPVATPVSPKAKPQHIEGVPVYDVDVTAGCLDLDDIFGNRNHPTGMVSLPGLSTDARIVKVRGDSMSPRIMNGGYIAINPCRDMRNIFWGQMYVVELEDFRLVKYVRRHPDTNYVVLHSDNPAYDDMEVLRSDIRSLYVVEAILNYEIN